MAITLNLSPDLELSESDVGACVAAQLEHDDGVPVLRTGQPIAISIIDETLDEIRREREQAYFERAE